MIQVWAQFVSVYLIIFLALGSYTGAYFFDSERSGNTLAASVLDGVLIGDPFADRVCAVSEVNEAELTFSNAGSIPFLYDVLIQNISGDACTNVELTVARNESELYVGPLEGFSYPDAPLDPSVSDVWRFSVSYPEGMVPETPTCDFDTVFNAHQIAFMSGEAFYDTESLSHSVIIETPQPLDVTIIHNNNATVTNNVNVSANTGGNSSTGGDGGGGEEGGDGGEGGDITTGDASASVTITNVINTNETVVVGCGCDGEEGNIPPPSPPPPKPKKLPKFGSKTGTPPTAVPDDEEQPEPEPTVSEVAESSSGAVVEIFVSTQTSTSTSE